jgi:hypothetical protein
MGGSSAPSQFAKTDRQFGRSRPGRPDLYRAAQRTIPVQRGGSRTEYKADLNRAIERGWLVLHESGTYVRFPQAGAEVFA